MKLYKMIFMMLVLLIIAIPMTINAVEPDIQVVIAEEITEEEIIERVEEVLEEDITAEELTDNTTPTKPDEVENNTSQLVVGGNAEAINEWATEQNIARGSVIYNVGVNNEEYDLAVLTEEEKQNKTLEELRQFIIFETDSGKVMHLIIDHSRSTDNVMLLTEVGEQDLLNMIEEEQGIDIVLEEDEEETVTIIEEKEPTTGNEFTSTDNSEPTTAPIDIQYIVMGVVMVLVLIFGYYFKIYKPKQDAAFDDEVDESDYLDDEEYEDDNEPLDEDKEV